MKLYSQVLESVALRSICSAPGPEIQAALLGRLDESYFHYEPCKAAFNRLQSVAKKRSVILGWTDLVEDPALNEEYRDILRESESKICRSVKRAGELVSSLDKYRKTRALYYMAKDIIEELKKPAVEVDEVLNSVTDKLTVTRSGDDIGQVIFTVGKNGNARDLVDEALSDEDEVLFKTGFKEIDERNGGVPSEGVLVLAATTSGGKSTLLMNLLMNMYKINKVSCANVSLEMNEKKVARRMLSRLTQIPYWKFVKKRLSKEEKAQCRKAWARFHKYGEKYDCQFGLITPVHSVTMTQVLTLAKPYGYKVIGLDYLSLLDGVDQDNQPRMLSAVTRQAKIFSAENKCLVIILCQLDSSDDRIRYSKGILEHADAAWTWNYFKPEVRETKTIPINQLKARDQELYPFELKEMFETMTVDNMDGAGPSDDDAPQASKTRSADLNLNEDVSVDYDAGQK